MIESKARDSGGFIQNTETTEAAPEVTNDRELSQQQDPLLNTVFADKYLILEALGAGGMSVVYLARHEALNKLFAIKTLHTHLTSKTSSLMRFKQEAQAASRLQHPGIVAMHDYGVTDDGTPYLVMDYVSGESLADLLSKIKSLAQPDALNIFKQTTAAIAHAHQRGVVHRDIKPSNIMLSFDDQNNIHVKIVDFGVAKFVEKDEETKLTQTGEALGSPLYMSPEQCLGQTLDTRSDIYSFGCVMYEALTGEPALASDGVFKTMMKHIHEVPLSFKEVRPDLSDTAELERIVFKALAKDPAKRYQKMDGMLDDLNGLHDQKGMAQKFKNKVELKGLQQTSRSIKIMVAASVLLGALILFGANCVFTLVQSLSASPQLMSENVIWPAYADKPIIKDRDEDNRSLLGSLQNLVLEGEQQALNTERGGISDVNARRSALALSQMTKARTQLRHHEYDVAEITYSNAIDNIKSYVDTLKDVAHANMEDKLMIAYFGRGDCEYFKPVPNYVAASADYDSAVKILRQTKANYNWTQLQAIDQLYLFLRNSDSLNMQGAYAKASATRLFIPELMRSVDRTMQDSSYKALTESKIAEEYFRQSQFAQAKLHYETAMKYWAQEGENFIKEQAIATGRLAEINNLQGGTDQNTKAFEEFDRLAQKAGRDDPKLLRTQFFTDAYQVYANYLWQHHQVAKAFEMHDRAAKCAP